MTAVRYSWEMGVADCIELTFECVPIILVRPFNLQLLKTPLEGGTHLCAEKGGVTGEG